ncbi:MAG: DUF4197 domain-containing protein, partial [Methylococcales bacterium]
MIKKKIGLTVAVLAVAISHDIQAGWQDLLGGAVDEAKKAGGTEIVKSTLSNSDAVSGIKEALANGVESAINTLGQSGGFLGNNLVEIAVPDSLKTIVSTARTLGQGEYVDSFETTMNQAAEKAVPEAAVILGDAIREM